MKIAIFGIGFLGRKLLEYFSPNHNVICGDINPKNKSVEKIDATNKKEIENFLFSEKPNIVIDTIALSSYFDCEKNPELCRTLNYDSAKYIAQVSKKINAKMVFISSSYIFNGEKGNYLESDLPNSNTKYAESKIDAENKVLELHDSIIIRSEPMYGFDNEKKRIIFGTNTFELDAKVGFPNLIRKPLYIDDLAPIIYSLIINNQSGIFNVAGPTKLKWLDFLTELSVLENSKHKIKIVDNSEWILKPPNDSSLDISKISDLGFETTDFSLALKKIRKMLIKCKLNLGQINC